MNGPYETESDTKPVTAPVYAAFRADPGVGKMAPHDRQVLDDVIAAAGVELGAYDLRILGWLAGWEPATCAVVAGLITRAHPPASGDLRPAVLAGNLDLTQAEIATVLDALDVAADYKRDRAASCPDCDASPADLCGTCEWRLAVADEYDALAARIGEHR